MKEEIGEFLKSEYGEYLIKKHVEEKANKLFKKRWQFLVWPILVVFAVLSFFGYQINNKVSDYSQRIDAAQSEFEKKYSKDTLRWAQSRSKENIFEKRLDLFSKSLDIEESADRKTREYVERSEATYSKLYNFLDTKSQELLKNIEDITNLETGLAKLKKQVEKDSIALNATYQQFKEQLKAEGFSEKYTDFIIKYDSLNSSSRQMEYVRLLSIPQSLDINIDGLNIFVEALDKTKVRFSVTRESDKILPDRIVNNGMKTSLSTHLTVDPHYIANKKWLVFIHYKE